MGTFGPETRLSSRRPRAAWVAAHILLIAALSVAGTTARPERLAAFDGRCVLDPPRAGCRALPSDTPDILGQPHSDEGNARGDRALTTNFVDATPAMSPAPTLEYQVKAAFLLSFVTFTEWPA